MTTAALIPMKWSDAGDRPNDTEYCACCDKWVKPGSRRLVEVTADMGDAVHPALGLDPAESGGTFTVGPDCARKYLPGFTVRA